MTIIGSDFVNNSGAVGGAIANTGGTTIVENSNFENKKHQVSIKSVKKSLILLGVHIYPLHGFNLIKNKMRIEFPLIE